MEIRKGWLIKIGQQFPYKLFFFLRFKDEPVSNRLVNGPFSFQEKVWWASVKAEYTTRRIILLFEVRASSKGTGQLVWTRGRHTGIARPDTQLYLQYTVICTTKKKWYNGISLTQMLIKGHWDIPGQGNDNTAIYSHCWYRSNNPNTIQRWHYCWCSAAQPP